MPLIVWVYLRWNFYGGSIQLFYFCKSDVLAVEGHPRSLILIPIESTHATSYYSVKVSNLGPILHRFGDIAGFLFPIPTPIPP